MNILQKIFTLLYSILSRVHLVRRKDQFTLTVKTKRIRTKDGISEKGVTDAEEVSNSK